jgi:ketosteroid isomerase-like protein
MTTTHQAPSGIDLTSLVEAITSRDAAGVAAWYADDATLTLHDKDHPPAAPQVYAGREQIEAYFRDVCGRNVEHQVRDVVADGNGFAFAQDCRYPDGTAVVCVTVGAVQGDRIQHQTISQSWDS